MSEVPFKAKLSTNNMKLIKQGWFGASTNFTSSIKYQYENTSMNKLTEKSNHLLQHEKAINKKQEKILKNKIRQKSLASRYQIATSKLQEAHIKLRDQQALDYIMNQASIKIQKIVRGYITRKRLEHVLIM